MGVGSGLYMYLRIRRKIGGKLVLIIDRKSYMSFLLVPKSVTLNDLERRNGPYFAWFLRNLVISAACCVKVVDRAINMDNTGLAIVFSERELTFTFAICYRPSVCRLSTVCNVRAPYLAGWNFWQLFYAIWYLGHPYWILIRKCDRTLTTSVR